MWDNKFRKMSVNVGTGEDFKLHGIEEDSQ